MLCLLEGLSGLSELGFQLLGAVFQRFHRVGFHAFCR